MTVKSNDILGLVSNNQTNIEDVDELNNLLTESIQFATSLPSLSGTNFQTALLEVVLRTIETYLLTDGELLKISKYYDAVYPRAEMLIRNRIKELTGIQPSEELVQYCRNCLSSYAARNDRTGGRYNTESNFVRLLNQIQEKWGIVEVRCCICGYHFREQDVGSWKKEIIEEYEFELAKYYHPKRQTDLIKPVKVRTVSLTNLEIDHIVPREGLGWDSVDNLRIACTYCNNGKMAFRRALEPISTVVAGAFCCYPEGREHSTLRQVSAVSAMQSAKGKCYRCNGGIQGRELTVIPRNEDDQSHMWFVPWNVQVMCYDCLD